MCRSSFDETLQNEVFSEKTSGLVESLRTLFRVEVRFPTKCSQSKHRTKVELDLKYISPQPSSLCEMFTLRTLGSEENFNAK